jgi:hypothetical protein
LPLFDVPPRGDRGAEKISGIGAAGDPEKTGEPGSTPWQTGRKTKKTETIQRDKLKKNKEHNEN